MRFKMKKKWLQLTFLILITVVFVYFLSRIVDWKEVVSHLIDVNVPFLVLFVLLIPSSFVTRAFRWHYLLRHEKTDTRLFNRFAAYAVSFTVTFTFPGRIWELVKPLYLSQKEDMKKGFVLGTHVLERIFDIFVMCFLLGLFLVTEPLYASLLSIEDEAFRRLKFWGIFGLIFAAVLLLLALALYFFKQRTLKIISACLKPFPKKMSGFILNLFEEFIHGLRFFHSARDFWMYALWSFIVWLGLVFQFYVLFLAYNFQVAYFFVIPYMFLIGVGASIPTPGMVVGYDAFSIFGLTTLYGMDTNLATGITLVSHGMQVLVTCLIGYVILSKDGISLLQAKKLGEESR